MDNVIDLKSFKKDAVTAEDKEVASLEFLIKLNKEREDRRKEERKKDNQSVMFSYRLKDKRK